MNSEQYEELCRLFVANSFTLTLDDVQSLEIPNPVRKDLRPYKHQIDLYWETGNEVAKYLHIANAKWRNSRKVGQGDVLLLQKVLEKVAAHKALLITNVGFTKGAIASAEDHGIALHILNPKFPADLLPSTGRDQILAKFREIGPPDRLYSHTVELRGVDSPPRQATRPAPSTAAPQQTRIAVPPATRAHIPSTPVVPRGVETRGGGSRGGPPGVRRG